MAYIYYHYDKSKMIKKSSKLYYSYLRRVKILTAVSLIVNIVLIYFTIKRVI